MPSFPSPPDGLTASASSSQVVLSWNAVTDATGYQVERDGAIIAASVTDTTYTDLSVEPDTRYTYRVRAIVRGAPTAVIGDAAISIETDSATIMVWSLTGGGGSPSESPATLPDFTIYPAVPGSYVSASPSDWQTKASSGASLVLENGTYSGSWTPQANQTIMARNPLLVTFEGNGTASSFVNSGGGNNARLWGVKVQNYGSTSSTNWQPQGLPEVIDGSGKQYFEVGWCDIGYSTTRGIEMGVYAYIHDSYIHDHSQYGLHSGPRCTVERVEAWNCGDNNSFNAPTNDKGFMKLAKTTYTTFRDITVHGCRHGPWWDIENTHMLLENFYIYDCYRDGVFLEVSYGPATVRNGLIEDCAYSGKFYYENANPAGLTISLTPDVTVENVTVRRALAGIIGVQWNHPQLSGDLSPTMDNTKLGVTRCLIKNCAVESINETLSPIGSAYGLVGTYPGQGVQAPDITFQDCTYDSGRLRSQTGVTFNNVTQV